MPNSLEDKQQLHEKADEKNVIATRWGRKVLLCGAENSKKPDGYCKALAGFGTNHPGWGRCKFCGGASTGPKTAAGKAAAAQNARKHGFYSPALSLDEKAVFEAQSDSEAVSLLNDIKVLRAKIITYLTKWRHKWDVLYQRKLAENYVKYHCTGAKCDGFLVRGDLEPKPGYCPKCSEKCLEEVERWVANRTPDEAAAYADQQTRVWYSETEKGGRSYYHAGSIEDRAYMRAVAELGRLIEKYHRLNPDDGEDLLSQINAELRAASKAQIAISWSNRPPLQRFTPEEAKERGITVKQRYQDDASE
jgi:hypothetical protein